MKRLLAALFLLAILPVPSAAAKTSKAPKINYKKRYIAKPYNKHQKPPAAKYGKR
jgi:hypothetical protein